MAKKRRLTVRRCSTKVSPAQAEAWWRRPGAGHAVRMKLLAKGASFTSYGSQVVLRVAGKPKTLFKCEHGTIAAYALDE